LCWNCLISWSHHAVASVILTESYFLKWTVAWVWQVILFSLYLPWTLASCQVSGYIPLEGQVWGQVIRCLFLAPGGSPAKVRQITFCTGYLKFCFGYSGYTDCTGYLSLSRLCHNFLCSLPLYFIFSSWTEICIY
jgi:hypothetical protein